MLTYYLKCRKNTENKNPKVARVINGRIMLLSKCAEYDSKTLKFIKHQEASGLLSTLGIKIALVGLPSRYRMNEKVNRFLLAGDIF